jgi:hypothetical protein
MNFLNEYEQANTAYTLCCTPRRYKIAENIISLPRQEAGDLIINN